MAQTLASIVMPSDKKDSHRHVSKNGKGISWSQVNFSVGGKVILKDVWGEVAPGKVCAILGPSGSGKSSLMNVLSGRSASASKTTVTGNVKVGGQAIDPAAFRQNIAYVMQDDALLPTATPRESLRFSAHLRLPSSISADELETLVSELLESLGLTECADVLIGGAMIKGISGGQRKRTCVGVEVITDPSLLFLDEPTSGLDSYSAYNLIKLLQDLASGGCAVLCTIHQPSSEVFFLFDTVVYMKDGRIFYQGPTEDIIPHFSEKGRMCPENYNPSDFVMNLAQQDTLQDLDAMGMMMDLSYHFAMEDVKTSSKRLDSEQLVFKSKSSFMRQIMAITYREVVNSYRDYPALIGRFGVTCFLAPLLGLIFFGQADKSNASNASFNTNVGLAGLLVIFAIFGSGQNVLLAFPFERPLVMREYATGTYAVTAYFLSKLPSEVVLTFASNVLMVMFVYLLADMQGNFMFISLVCFGLGMVANSIAMFVGCLLPDVKNVTEAAPLLYVPQILFAGFFIRTSQIPVYLRWAQYLCGMKYGFNMMVLTEFQVNNPTCQGPEAAANCREVKSANNVEEGLLYEYILLMFALFVGFRLLAAIILVQKTKRFY